VTGLLYLIIVHAVQKGKLHVPRACKLLLRGISLVCIALCTQRPL